MKVAICCLNSKYIHASLAPWCLLGGVNKLCKNVSACIVEGTINQDNSVIVEKLTSTYYDVVSFSSYIWNIQKTLEIAREVKEKTGACIVLGGPEVSYRAQDVLSTYSFIDYISCGEGEESFPLLLNGIEENSIDAVPGLCYRKGDKIKLNDEKHYSDTPANPYCNEFFEKLRGRITYIETSRGCPYRCAFCLSGRCSDLRFFDLEEVKGNIIKLANSGTKTVKFVDRTFNANVQRADTIIDFIINNRLNSTIPKDVCFHFEIAGDILKESTLKLLGSAPAGLFQLEIGMQSFNEKTLKAINRKTDTKKLIENIKKLIAFGNMHIHIDLIAGLPFEDIKSFENSFNIGYNLNANMLQMGFLKLLHGAEMRENQEKYPCNFTKKPPYEVIKTPWLSEEEIKMLKKCEDALDRMYNSGRFIFTLEYLINDTDCSPFKLFFDFGNAVDANKKSLSDYAVEIYRYFENKVDNELLREAIICDLLSCSSALQIPDIFKIKDPLYKQIKKHFAEGSKDKIQIAVLYKSNKVYVVNQSQKKNFSGRYQGSFYSLKDFK